MTTNTTVREIVVERPGRARVLEGFGLDYCCGGGKALGDACGAKGLEVDAVVQALLESDAAPQPAERNWAEASLPELIDEIMTSHHAYLREAMPRISDFLTKVAGKHGERRPELVQTREAFQGFRQEMEAHLSKEERILFPLVRAMDAKQPTQGFPASVAGPIQCMEAEHEDAGAALELFRRLLNDFVPPDDACGTYRVMLEEMAALEANTHQHVHKENNILFPRAIELERANTEVRW
ncbi:MAG TPA: iron-sulfur cluster repair di-iron protein [Armatimonadota bacterium]|jgi:regulator of cell morphogenesis and NO signaling